MIGYWKSQTCYYFKLNWKILIDTVSKYLLKLLLFLQYIIYFYVYVLLTENEWQHLIFI